MSSSIENMLQEIEQSIQQEQQRKAELGKRAKTFAIIAGVCLAGVVLVKAPIFLLGAAVGGTGLAVTTWLRGQCDARLDNKYQTQATLMIAQEAARSPQVANGLQPDAGLRQGFAQNAQGQAPANNDRIDELANAVDDLREQVEGKPQPLDKPKTIFKGFRRK
jgi:hypothetical protein